MFGKSFEEHLKNMALVFARIREAGLKLKHSKCFFFQKQVKYLRQIIISEHGVATDPSKIDKVLHWPFPKSKLEVQQFLGLASYYRRFIFDFATIAKPLHRLTEQNRDFRWTNECQASFEALRGKLVSASVLAFPDFSKPFLFDTDASDGGIGGGVLSQLQADRSEWVVGYGSRTLSKAERNYCVTRRVIGYGVFC